jgi:hypothetical protein
MAPEKADGNPHVLSGFHIMIGFTTALHCIKIVHILYPLESLIYAEKWMMGEKKCKISCYIEWMLISKTAAVSSSFRKSINDGLIG